MLIFDFSYFYTIFSWFLASTWLLLGLSWLPLGPWGGLGASGGPFQTIANSSDSGPMPSFYTMFCYVTLGVPLGTLRKYCKYHASGLSGVFRDPLGTSWCFLGSPGVISGRPVVHLGVPGAGLGASLGSPRGLPEPLWGLPVPPRDTPGALCVLPVTLPGLPGNSPEPPGTAI